MSTTTHQIVIASDPENIVELEHFVDDINNELGFSDDLYPNIIVSLTEAVNNGIIHGNDSDPSKNVTVTCNKKDKSIVFTVKDEGPGFNYNDLPDPTDPENLGKLTGRGVFLMKQLSDYLIYSNGGNTVELEFKL